MGVAGLGVGVGPGGGVGVGLAAETILMPPKVRSAIRKLEQTTRTKYLDMFLSSPFEQ